MRTIEPTFSRKVEQICAYINDGQPIPKKMYKNASAEPWVGRLCRKYAALSCILTYIRIQPSMPFILSVHSLFRFLSFSISLQLSKKYLMNALSFSYYTQNKWREKINWFFVEWDLLYAMCKQNVHERKR